MSDGVTVLCPTRGRPDSIQFVQQSFDSTATRLDSELIFVIDNDEVDLYREIIDSPRYYSIIVPNLGNMGAATNRALPVVYGLNEVIGFIGDDNRFRTQGWDERFVEALKDGGIAWGDDDVHGDALPTSWFVSEDIVKAVGWLCNPAVKHFFMDNSWLEIGKATHSLHYCPDVRIEHLHFSFGKSKLDETYQHTMRVGAGDNVRFEEWFRGQDFKDSVQRVKDALLERIRP